MNRYILFGFLGLFLAGFFAACQNGARNTEQEESREYLSWAQRMADSDIKRNPEAWMVDFNTKPRWNYTHGLMCSAMERVWRATGDEKYYNYIAEYADRMIEEDGTIKTYNQGDYNIDMINSGKFLFTMWKETGDPKYEKAIHLLREQMKAHPRTSEGGFWHKKIYPHQMWLDGLYMGSPFLVQYANEFGENELYDEVALQVRLITKHARDSATGLFYHGWDESREQAWSNKETGLSPHVWGRGMGWYAMALVDILELFPKEHEEYEQILGVARGMAEAIAGHQDEQSGVWYQVVNMPGEEGNYLEASASSMFVYFLSKGVRLGYLDQTYYAVAEKGFQGIIDEFIKVNETEDGEDVELTQVCAVAGLGGNPYRDGSYEYYVNETIRSNDPKGVGPFIMLCLELDKYHAGDEESLVEDGGTVSEVIANWGFD